MLTKSILTATAIALVATIGSATAGEQFSALEGIPAVPMSVDEQAAAVGAFGLDNNIRASGKTALSLDSPATIAPWVPTTDGTSTAAPLV